LLRPYKSYGLRFTAWLTVINHQIYAKLSVRTFEP